MVKVQGVRKDAGDAGQILAKKFEDGTLLDSLAQDAVRDLKENVRGRSGLAASGLALNFKWGTICSGSEVMLLVLVAISAAYRNEGVELTFKHSFSCESDPQKRKWIKSLFLELGVESGCIFKQAEHMGCTEAPCCKHNRNCPVPCVDLLVTGTSCKDFSKANKKQNNVLAGPRSLGGSAETFWGVLAYLRAHVVSLCLFENVDALDENAGDEHTSYLKLVRSYFDELGFSSMSALLDAALFALSEERRRYYIVAIKKDANPILDLGLRPCLGIFELMKDLLTRCQRTPPCLSQVLLKEDDSRIDLYLNDRLAEGAKETQYNVAASIATFRHEGLMWGATIAEDSTWKSSPWFQTLAKLQQNALEFSQAQQSGNTICRDISQSLSRLRYSKQVEGRHIAMCQMPGQVVWLETKNCSPRLQLPIESCIIQGFPVGKVPALCQKFSGALLASMAGNMMGATLPLAILLSLFEAAQWRGSSGLGNRTVSPGNVAEAMRCFELSQIKANEMEKDEQEVQNEQLKTLKKRRLA